MSTPDLDSEGGTFVNPEEVVEANLVLLKVDHAHLDPTACSDSRHHCRLVFEHVMQFPILVVQDVRLIEGHDVDV